MNTITNNNWNEILIRFKKDFNISDISFKTWIAPLSFQSINDDTVHIIYNGDIPNIAIRYIEKHYLDYLKFVIKDITGKEFSNVIISNPNSNEENNDFPAHSDEEHNNLHMKNVEPERSFYTKQYGILVALYSIQKLLEKEEYQAANELVENLISVYKEYE